jgi:hypothetical protein
MGSGVDMIIMNPLDGKTLNNLVRTSEINQTTIKLQLLMIGNNDY